MRYAAAYLLAILGGNPSPTVASIAAILNSVGIECDETQAQKVIDACRDRNVDEIIAGGMNKLATLSSSNVDVTAPAHIDDTTTLVAASATAHGENPVAPPDSPSGSETGFDFDLFGQ